MFNVIFLSGRKSKKQATAAEAEAAPVEATAAQEEAAPVEATAAQEEATEQTASTIE